MDLELEYNATRIATLRKRRGGGGLYKILERLYFTHKDRGRHSKIFSDLEGKKVS